MTISNLFNQKLNVVNIGLESFNESLNKTNTNSVHIDWAPPMAFDQNSMKILKKHGNEINEANQKAIEIILSGKPILVDMGIALDTIPGMKKNMILHAGPPITWDRMCGPMKGAILGALIYEDLAKTEEEAESLAASGKIEFNPCHEHQAVGPMAGIISPSMPVFVVKNETYENLSYTTMNEGLGKVLRFGAYGPEVITRLHWMADTLYPALKNAIKSLGKIDIKNIIAQALHMGDEAHNRNRAVTSLFIRAITPSLVRTGTDKETTAKVIEFINGNDHFCLNLAMAASKATLDAARNISHSSIVIAMCRNGTDFGIQVSGTKNEWFTGAANIPDALFFPGFSKEDANPDLGDSAITEPSGLGAFAIAASPAIVQFIGGTVSDAVNYTKQMYEITASENNVFQIPYLEFRGTPTGIDIRKVVEKNILPLIDTGVAHKKPGIGQVGAGIVRASADPFIKAISGLAKHFL